MCPKKKRQINSDSVQFHVSGPGPGPAVSPTPNPSPNTQLRSSSVTVCATENSASAIAHPPSYAPSLMPEIPVDPFTWIHLVKLYQTTHVALNCRSTAGLR